jgi:hypothetical protein
MGIPWALLGSIFFSDSEGHTLEFIAHDPAAPGKPQSEFLFTRCDRFMLPASPQ